MINEVPRQTSIHSLSTSFFLKVINGSSEFGLGSQHAYTSKTSLLHFTVPIYVSANVLTSRVPVLLPNYGNLVRPLPPTVWATVLCMVAAMSLVVMAINKVYERLDETLGLKGDERLTRRVLSYADYFVKTFSTMTEPELLSWFPRWSAGAPRAQLSMRC